jgi:hypothetical protein
MRIRDIVNFCNCFANSANVNDIEQELYTLDDRYQILDTRFQLLDERHRNLNVQYQRHVINNNAHQQQIV